MKTRRGKLVASGGVQYTHIMHLYLNAPTQFLSHNMSNRTRAIDMMWCSLLDLFLTKFTVNANNRYHEHFLGKIFGCKWKTLIQAWRLLEHLKDRKWIKVVWQLWSEYTVYSQLVSTFTKVLIRGQLTKYYKCDKVSKIF